MVRLTQPFALIFMAISTTIAFADEGMWLLNDPPRGQLKDRYGFELTDGWLRRAMKASVRFNNGGSGGFVSSNGLIVTNHHIGADSLQKLSSPGRDLLAQGFLARTLAEELKCPDLELNVLQSIEDVTAHANAAVKPDLPAAEAATARRSIFAAIEKESLDKTGLRSDVVTLYQGGLYHLYRYKKFTDVRMVFAPEAAAANFGGDVDNFEYPRFGFDVCFVRAYEGGQPAKTEHFFHWAKVAPAEGDLVFVTGHPGTTNRLETVDRLIHRRDQSHPQTLARLRAMEALLTQFSEQGPNERRVAATDLHRIANSRKAVAGQYQALLNPEILRRKIEDEAQLKSTYAPDPNRPSPWEQIAQAQRALAQIEVPYNLLEHGDGFYSQLFTIARHIVRLSAEISKPNGERLRDYRDSNLESLKLQIFSPAPLDADLERAKLAGALTFMAEQLGGAHPLVRKILSGKPPNARAAELIAGCGLFDPARRKALLEGGAPAIAECTDTMIQLARLIDDDARAIRKRHEEEVEEPERQAYAKIAETRFAAHGRTIAPDATFTLRLAFGKVAGYEENSKAIPFQTTFAGLFDRGAKMDNREPFTVVHRWQAARAKLDFATPINFVSTADTIGGNSGSPVLNRAGELVGINFDRNRPGLVRNFVYTELQARHVAVHGLGVIAGLRIVYGASELATEIAGE